MKNLSKTPEKKFQTRSGVIKHKRVTKKLWKSKKQLQNKQRAGLKGARVTWQSHGNATGSDNGSAMAKIREEKLREVKESQGKKSEEKLREDKRRKSKEKDIDISNSDSNEQFSSSTSLRARAPTGEANPETPDYRPIAEANYLCRPQRNDSPPSMIAVCLKSRIDHVRKTHEKISSYVRTKQPSESEKSCIRLRSNVRTTNNKTITETNIDTIAPPSPSPRSSGAQSALNRKLSAEARLINSGRLRKKACLSGFAG